jgi:outer membrane protein assembly factor BamB
MEFRLPLERHNQVFERAVYYHPLLYAVERNGTLHAYWVDREREHFRFKSQYPFMADPYVHSYRVVEKVRDEKDATKVKDVERKYDILCIGGMDKAFYALDAGGGFVLWKYHLPAVVKTPAIGKDGTIYVKTEDGYLHALEAMPQHVDKDGAVQGPWSFGRLRWQMPRAERFVLKTGTGVYVMAEDNLLTKVEELTGRVIGQYPVQNFPFIMTNTMDDLLYLVTTDGHLLCLREWREQDLWRPTDRATIKKKAEEAPKPAMPQEGGGAGAAPGAGNN